MSDREEVRLEATRPRSVACVSLSERKRVVRAGAVGWWRRRATDPAGRVPLLRTGAVWCGVVIGSLVLLRVFAATASSVLVALVFMVFAVAIFLFQWRADETDAADPTPMRNRGTIASAGRVSRAWLSSAAPVVTGLPSRFARAVAVLRREHTRDTLRQWLHATTDALSGIPPPDVSPPALEDSGEGPSPSSRHAA
jgi:hypothetical protein